MIGFDDVRDAMARHDFDAMLLGREANARAVAGTKRLWLAGTRAFSPGCVVVRDPGSVHVLAITDDAVPPGFAVDNLFGITWNPEKLLASLVAIPGLRGSRRVAVDGMTPLMHALLARAMPDVRYFDASPLLAELSLRPDDERVAGVRAAGEVARAGLRAMAAALEPGVRPRTLRGVCAETFASFGVTTPAFEAVASPLDGTTSTWFPPERVLGDGERVVLRAGAIRDGWEASAARTAVVGSAPAVDDDTPALWPELLGACRAGTTVGALRARGAVVYGVARGVEPWDDDFVLVAGLTCAIEATTTQWLRQDVVVIGDDGADPLA
jgi:Xaa-Pro dipeptidase